ncbi:MAG TPA: MinD/ParA family protein [Bacteroidota bacterium]|nr:MinD/ParA family protein [Bacteroidota bacterium]
MRDSTAIMDQASRLRQIALEQVDVQAATMPYRITVTSGKGGVGKSTVALNLAIALSDAGQKVLLVDADSNLGNIDVLLGIAPRYRLGHILHGRIDIEDALVSPFGNLKILPGSSGDSDYPEMTNIVQERFLQDLFSLEEHFDFLLIDTSAGLSRETMTYALEVDEAIIVTSIEPTSVMDSYAVIKTITIARPEERISILMNAAQAPSQADETVQKLRMAVDHFLKRDIGYLGAIPFDPDMRNAVLAQEPVLKRYPSGAASLSLKSVAQNIIQQSLLQESGKR